MEWLIEVHIQPPRMSNFQTFISIYHLRPKTILFSSLILPPLTVWGGGHQNLPSPLNQNLRHFFPFPFVLPLYPIAKYFLFRLINKFSVPIQSPLPLVGTVFPPARMNMLPSLMNMILKRSLILFLLIGQRDLVTNLIVTLQFHVSVQQIFPV